ncbi:MAG: 6-hydroxymethylpterin diphosphokinase MptE-like protein [bacterium]
MGGTSRDHDEPILTPREGGYQVVYRGRRLYGDRDPLTAADRRAAAVVPEHRTLYIVPSPLLGYGMHALLRAVPGDSCILAIEIDANLARLSRERIPAELFTHHRVALVLGGGATEDMDADSRGGDSADRREGAVEEALAAFGQRRFRRVRMVTLSGGYSLNADAYRSVADYAVREIQRQWQNVLTEVHLGRRWMRNLLRNLPLLVESRDAKDLRTDRPIVVAAAGPSLEETIPVIRRIRREVCVVAVDTAAAPLLAGGVRPDLVVTLDGQWANVQDFVGLPCAGGAAGGADGGAAGGADATAGVEASWGSADPHARPVPLPALVGELSAYPTALRSGAEALCRLNGCPEHAGADEALRSLRNSGFGAPHRRLFSTDFAPLRILDRMAGLGLRPLVMRPRGSVGITAVELALRMTPRQVFVCGLDLAFDPVHTHARGSAIHRWHLRTSNRLDPLPAWRLSLRHNLLHREDKAGGETSTTAVLLSYAEQLREPATQENRLVDISPRGIPLGIRRVAPDQLERTLVPSGRGAPGTATPTPTPTAGDSGAVAGDGAETGADGANGRAAGTPTREGLRVFLTGEIDLLDRLAAAARGLLDGSPVSAADSDSYRDLLEECNYVWLHFPDGASAEEHFIGRLLPAVEEYRRLIDVLRHSL